MAWRCRSERADGVPILFATGYGSLPPAYADCPVSQKPYAPEALPARVADLVRDRPAS